MLGVDDRVSYSFKGRRYSIESFVFVDWRSYEFYVEVKMFFIFEILKLGREFVGR